MTPHHGPYAIAIAFVAACASCGTRGDSPPSESAVASLPVIRMTDADTELPFTDVELSLEIVSRDHRGLPKDIRITYRNKSAERGCLPLPRPFVEEHDDPTLPGLCVGMRGAAERAGLHPPEPVFLYTIPRREFAGPLEGVYLDPGASFARQYALTSFCLIGHGIAPNPNANFFTCYRAGNEASELRAYLITNWSDLPKIASNPVKVRSSELDFSVREKLGE
jgi:hypothetical protein